MSYHAAVLADSVSPDGVRLTTLMVRFPRFILAEFNTPRMFSRSSASSRAIPTELFIEQVRNDPFIPETFNRRVRGMGIGDELDAEASADAEAAWRTAAWCAVNAAERLMKIGIDKSRANRVLEPYLWHTAIFTATEWSNFFALRCPPGDEPDSNFPAQVEFQWAAIFMRDAMAQSTPVKLDYGEWHLPAATLFETGMAKAAVELNVTTVVDDIKMACAGRLARWSSYDNQTDEPIDSSIRRAESLKVNHHMSPFEHIARPLTANPEDDDRIVWGAAPALADHDAGRRVPTNGDTWDSLVRRSTFVGNFRGWVQMRKEIPNEDDASKATA